MWHWFKLKNLIQEIYSAVHFKCLQKDFCSLWCFHHPSVFHYLEFKPRPRSTQPPPPASLRMCSGGVLIKGLSHVNWLLTMQRHSSFPLNLPQSQASQPFSWRKLHHLYPQSYFFWSVPKTHGHRRGKEHWSTRKSTASPLWSVLSSPQRTDTLFALKTLPSVHLPSSRLLTSSWDIWSPQLEALTHLQSTLVQMTTMPWFCRCYF